MAWITINNDECPGCQRKGDEGARVDGKCWRCNLPDTLDPVEHAKLRENLEWEYDNLRETMSDVNSLTENAFRSNYGQSKAYAQHVQAALGACAESSTDPHLAALPAWAGE